MKIGIVSNLYPPEARGGAELVAQRVADRLYERGHDVFVLTTQPFEGVRSLFPRVRERHMEAVYRFYPCNLYYLKSDGRMPFVLKALWHVIDLIGFCGRRAMRQVIADEQPDVILTHNLKGIGVAVGREIQLQDVPHVHTLHDVQLSVPSGLLIAGKEDKGLNVGKPREWYERAVTWAMGRPDVIVSPSQFLADFYHERGLFNDSRTEILPNPLPPDEIEPRMKRVDGPTRLFFVGQLERHKGVVELFRALDRVEGDIELHVVGEGALSQFVTERAARDKRVKYHGFVSLGHLISMLSTADAVVVPSTCYENSPTVIYEAFQVGVPVIASDIGGIPELIEHGETGWLVEPGNVDALAKAIRRCHERRESWWETTRTIHERAKPYHIDRYVDRLEEILRDVVG